MQKTRAKKNIDIDHTSKHAHTNTPRGQKARTNTAAYRGVNSPIGLRRFLLRLLEAPGALTVEGSSEAWFRA